MNFVALPSSRIRGVSPDRLEWRHGARLALAVVFAFLASSALRMPESFWAVMSALIVVRPTAGSTLGAGWDRVRGTLSGTVIGLAGVWLRHVGVGGAPSTLLIIAALAFASALLPALRSAPISALIVLTSGGIAGHSALDVAGLRAIEIAIGVVVGLAVSLLAFAEHARTRFDAACAAWLRDAAVHAAQDLAPAPLDQASRDARSESSRKALRSLAEVAVGADREERWFAMLRRAGTAAPSKRVLRARLTTRIASDIGAVVRAASCAPQPLDAAARARLAEAVRDAVDWVADALDANARRGAGPAALRAWSSADPPVPWLAAPTRLLLQDLVALRRMASTPGAEGNQETA